MIPIRFERDLVYW
jgi:hypothetical protein